MKTILIADDNPAICRILERYGIRDGYQVLTATDGITALKLFEQHHPSVVLLDIMMPGIDGVELCRKIRAISNVPILMITARTSDHDRITGLDSGADDYIVKPFSPGEVMARIRAVLRRASDNPDSGELHRGTLHIYPEKNLVLVHDQTVVLTKREFDVLWTLASAPERIFTRENLLDAVWGYSAESNDRAVDSCIKRLRAKLDICKHEDFAIKTVWGLGYRLEITQEDRNEA